MRRLQLEVEGIVQGVGFRPFVARTARRLGLGGWVRNDGARVLIEVVGGSREVGAFIRALEEDAPPAADVHRIHSWERPPVQTREFRIQRSECGDPLPVLPADLALCGDCAREVRDPTDRRFGYPFTNCTACGPRWSIVRGLPYDRPRTSMAGFPLCDACAVEYADEGDRRYHAQPVACPDCGPRLTLEGSDSPLEDAVARLRDGEVLALKGLGGFQLLVDARSGEAVRRLRERKRRPSKPLAVLSASLEAARELAHVDEAEAAALTAAAAPIVLLRAREGALAEEVAPGNPWVGVMLPTTPLHLLLAERFGGPLVCTSGNLSEEPMCLTEEQARHRLEGIADAFLVHDRPIVRPVDDSVLRVLEGRTEVLRRARGFAPRPIPMVGDVSGLLAMGAHLKNAVALGIGGGALLSPHIGDLETLSARNLLERTVEDLLGFFQVEPRGIVCDLHPDYASTFLAEDLAERHDVPLRRVQHHHAHIAACLAEHQLEGPVLGLAWDGTGLGDDGTIWGGEALVVDGSAMRRLGHLRDFPLPGGDAASRDGRRSAAGLLHEMGVEELQGARFAPRTSSMGRLFDGLASLAGLRHRSRHEGEAAQALEYAAGTELGEGPAYELPLTRLDGRQVADWAPMMAALRRDVEAGLEPGELSRRFHRGLAGLALAWAQAADLPTVVLTGGCFQNRLLRSAVAARLRAEGYDVRTPSRVPPGDGGICLGQLWVAARAGGDA